MYRLIGRLTAASDVGKSTRNESESNVGLTVSIIVHNTDNLHGYTDIIIYISDTVFPEQKSVYTAVLGNN